MSVKNILAVSSDRYLLVQHSRNELLRHVGHKVTSTANIAEALQFLANDKFDLVLLCHSLSGGERDQLLAATRNGKPHVPVILLYARHRSDVGPGITEADCEPESFLKAVDGLSNPQPEFE